MKKCFRCNELKDINEFGIHTREKDGRRRECKLCRRVKERKSNSGQFKKGESRYPEHQFQKDRIPWNKDKKGVMPEPWNKGLREYEGRRGKKYYDWANAVKERDKWTCQECFKKEGLIVAHHVIPWNENESKRFDIDNGKTLCQPCHAKIEGFQEGHECMRKTDIGLFKRGQQGPKTKFKKGMIPWNKGLKLKKV